MPLNFSDPALIIGAVVIVLAIVVGIAIFVRRSKQTTAGFRKRFGSEYEREVLEHGSEHKAEVRLADREARVERMKIRVLDPTERQRFVSEWQATQARFLDHPKSAVSDADELVNSVLLARGYPKSEFDQRAADVSVDYPRLMEPYRSAHGVAVTIGVYDATTEDLRTAMIQYRTIFDELLRAS